MEENRLRPARMASTENRFMDTTLPSQLSGDGHSPQPLQCSPSAIPWPEPTLKFRLVFNTLRTPPKAVPGSRQLPMENLTWRVEFLPGSTRGRVVNQPLQVKISCVTSALSWLLS